jgi:hypothetical protein
MKRILLAAALIMGLSYTNSFAQMDHGMMREIDKDIQNSTMMEQKELIDKGALTEKGRMQHEGGISLQPELMMGHSEMMDSLKDLTYDMSNMMNYFSRIIGNMSGSEREKSKKKLQDVANMMRQICSEMGNMANIMESGMITDAEMTMMRSRVMEMQESVSELRK